MISLLSNTEVIEMDQVRFIISELEYRIEILENDVLKALETIKLLNGVLDTRDQNIDELDNRILDIQKKYLSAKEVIEFYATSPLGQRAKDWLNND